MKPFTSKHCTQYLTKSSPLNQTEDPAGSKKTQRIRKRIKKNKQKFMDSEIGSKKEERLYEKDMRLTDKLRDSRNKDKKQ
jgi:hypothetical protein